MNHQKSEITGQQKSKETQVPSGRDKTGKSRAYLGLMLPDTTQAGKKSAKNFDNHLRSLWVSTGI